MASLNQSNLDAVYYFNQISCIIFPYGIGHHLSLRDAASLALTAKVFCEIMRDSIFLWSKMSCIQLNTSTLIMPAANSRGLPESTLSFLLKLAKKAQDQKCRAREQVLILDKILDSLSTLYPSKLFPTERTEGPLHEIFKELGVAEAENPDYSGIRHTYGGALLNRLLLFKITSLQKMRFITLLPLNLLNFSLPHDVREICDRFQEQKQLNKPGWQKTFSEYFKNNRLIASVLNETSDSRLSARCFIRSISIDFFKFYLECHPKILLNFTTIKAFNAIASSKEAYDKLTAVVSWYFKHLNVMECDEAENLFAILSIANHLMKKNSHSQGPLTTRLRDREIRGLHKKTSFLTLSQVQSWIPKEHASWHRFKSLIKWRKIQLEPEDLELQKFFTD